LFSMAIAWAGGLVGFELTRLLQKEGGRSLSIFSSQVVASPHMIDRERITYNLPEPELLEELRKLNGTPEEILENLKLIQVLLPILRADFELVETYKCSLATLLSIPISVFGGLQDEKIELQHLEAWCEHTTASYSVRMLPGNHFFLHTAQLDLLRLIAQKLLTIVPQSSWGAANEASYSGAII
jgi:surfactin synthase thioesterase subunit